MKSFGDLSVVVVIALATAVGCSGTGPTDSPPPVEDAAASPDVPEPEDAAPEAGPADVPATPDGADAAAPVVALYEDEDGDGLTGIEELAGWEIFVDFSGFSLNYADFLTRTRVTSDPFVADSDGDGLLDGEEFLLKTDPAVADTDGDGLSDMDEVRRWQTSPVSVDSDADSRDASAPLSQPPDPKLFDGAELQLVPDPLDPTRMIPGPHATSPVMRDSDGDGVDDREEHRHAFRNPSVAELPAVVVDQVDSVDVRLDVSYAETQGSSFSYGSALTTTETTTSTKTVSFSNTTWASTTVEVGATASIGIPTGVTVSAGETTATGMSQSKSVTFDEKSSTSMSESHSQFFKDSVGRTITTGGGHITASIRVTNPTSIAYVIDDLGIAVRQAGRPGVASKTLGVLLPAEGFDGFGMAPFSESPVIPFFGEFDTGTLLEVMAEPDSLVLEPAGFKVSNADATDFVFVTEEVVAVTGGLVIDAGDGEPHAMRVAAAVDRTDDGDHAGYRLSHALQLLGVDYETATNSVTGRSMLARVGDQTWEVAEGPAPELGDPEYPEGVDPGPRLATRFWSVLGASRGEPLNLDQDFEAYTIGPGQELVLALVRDEDRDGVIDRVEELRGASDAAIHSDATADFPTGDALSDFFEILVGWEVQLEPTDPDDIPPASYRVHPHPGRMDTDGDGWNDRDEYDAGTDPTLWDTDGDSMPDPTDPEPLRWFNDGPTVAVSVVDSALDVVLSIDADDAQNNIDTIVVDWGDSSPTTRLEYRDEEVRSGLVFDLGHSYLSDGVYPITVTVTDMFGEEAIETLEADVLSVPKGALIHLDFEPVPDYCYGPSKFDDPADYLDRFGGPYACYKTNSTGQGDPSITFPNPAPYAQDFAWSFWVKIHSASTGSYPNFLVGIGNYPMLAVYGNDATNPNARKIEVMYSNTSYPWYADGHEEIYTNVSNDELIWGGWNHIYVSFETTATSTFQLMMINGQFQGLHIVPFVFDPGPCNMYLNKAPWHTDVIPEGATCKQLEYSPDSPSASWDDVRVYDRILDPQEVDWLYLEGP